MTIITAVSAGAGSGKTYDLAQHISRRVVEGQDPAKVLATTFTKKAATELRARIEARILAEPSLPAPERIVRAKRLEMAPIGTVHSVAYQLLQKYALRLGLSPNLEILEEGASTRLIREFQNNLTLDSHPGFAEACRRLSLDNPGETALELLQLMRGNRISREEFRHQMITSLDELCSLISPNPNITGDPFVAIAKLAEQAIESIMKMGDTTKKTKEAISKLHEIASHPGIWKDFLGAAKIAAAKVSDGFLTDLRLFCVHVRDFKSLHEDLRLYVDSLIEMTLRLEADYSEYKRQRGLLDFTDLEIEFLRLLETPELSESLTQDIELLAVDEFQDTNPIQLAIFQSLRGLVSESRWVGDPKQAIYGFRGADSELMNQVWNQIPAECQDRLENNYRSQAGLVDFYNKLFKPIFGSGSELKSQNPPESGGLERWLLQSANKEQDSAALAVGVTQLLQDGFQPGEIAVLARTRNDAVSFAKAVKELGIPCVTETPGLFDTRECALVLAALRVAVDRWDSLAAATIVHILSESRQGTPPWINERLRAVKEFEKHKSDSAPWADNAVLNSLKELNTPISPVTATLNRVIEVLGVSEALGKWEQPHRRGAHLDNLLMLGAQYEQEAAELGQAATLTGLIAYFEQLWSEENDQIVHPEGMEAVTITTYHSSKGLEWPIVILTGLNFGHDPDLWKARVTGGAVKESRPLEGRVLRFWPWPFGRNPFNGKTIEGSNLENDALNTEEGIRFAEVQKEESKRLLYVGMTRARRKLVLTHRPGKSEWLQLLPGVDALLPPQLSAGEHPLTNIKTSLIVREPSADKMDSYRKPSPEEQLWLAPVKAVLPQPLIERFHNPSLQDPVPVKEAIIENLPGSHPFPTFKKTDQYEALGNAVHAYLAATPSLIAASDSRKAEIAIHCLKSFGAEGLIAPQALVNCGNRLDAWLAQKGCNARVTEVPVTTPRSGGGQWLGIIDLLAEVGDGQVLIIDHKSRPIPAQMAQASALEFTGQLAAYREILKNQGYSVTSSWIHFPLAGVMVQIG